ncbi:DUF4139 domain-containing protein [candidate division KSB1 bacterium]|nr:DUF4139 domain-containing protein [candidate division KSB1 bacterium]MBL7093725.1 DUF4139 domain-containing protein [candidate division KSB1 bacterium]
MKKLFFISVFLLINLTLFAQDRNVAITVYNNNLAVVKDLRMLELKKGIFDLSYKNVASKIDPTSVHFKSITAPDKVNILEQNYEYDLVSTAKIAQKYLDKEISVYLKNDAELKGKLISYEFDNLILQTANGRIKSLSKSNIVDIDFPALPEGLITKPTLVWKIENGKAGNHKTEVSYMTSGMKWHTEYVAVAKENDKKLELNAWVSIDNKSGATYPQAKLKLIAGDVHKVQQPRRRRDSERMMLAAVAKAEPQFEEKEFFEYHMYTLNRKSTLKNNQVKQISLFPATETNVKKVYTYEPRLDNKKIRVNLEFVNSKKAGLGMPLPAGKVRVYKEDPADNSLEFIGEDKLDHTPKNEKVKLFLGNAFDIKAERSMINKKSTSKRSHEETWQIKIRNHKKTNVEVLVIEKFYGFWEIKESTLEYKKVDARTLHFLVSVPKDQESVLTYTISYPKR